MNEHGPFLTAALSVLRLRWQLYAALRAEFSSAICNPTQALLLAEIGDGELAFGEIARRTAYIGANRSYILNRLIGHGLLQRRVPDHDRRFTHITVAPAGAKIQEKIAAWDRRNSDRMRRLLSDPGPAVQGISDFKRVVDALPYFVGQEVDARNKL